MTTVNLTEGLEVAAVLESLGKFIRKHSEKIAGGWLPTAEDSIDLPVITLSPSAVPKVPIPEQELISLFIQLDGYNTLTEGGEVVIALLGGSAELRVTIRHRSALDS